MKIEEVPQDRGMITDDRREVCYAIDDQGRYVLTGSAGWEPKNIANRQAWEQIDQSITAAWQAFMPARPARWPTTWPCIKWTRDFWPNMPASPGSKSGCT
ncbi:hypothetical protein [Desulfosarcina cetonica]|uniref:hypothetical protein n=1 Tax=Desulfosarcina cetonica TaxID=90730 RepID=UPI0006D18816|nr:hypothetical protein [Desulfosarcina cetonica]